MHSKCMAQFRVTPWTTPRTLQNSFDVTISAACAPGVRVEVDLQLLGTSAAFTKFLDDQL
jgi:hypothetical protein